MHGPNEKFWSAKFKLIDELLRFSIDLVNYND